MTRTDQDELSLPRAGAIYAGPSIRLWRLAARLAVFVCAFLVLPSSTFSQNVQHTQNTVDQAFRSDLRVDPSTLGLSLTITLGNYPGRGGLSVPVSVQYSSKGLWKMEYSGYYQEGPCCEPSFTANPQGLPTENNYSYVNITYGADPGSGWRSGFQPPSLVDGFEEFYNLDGDPCAECDLALRYYVLRLRVRMPDGSTHELRRSDAVYLHGQVPQGLGTYVSVDGSRLRYVEGPNGTATLHLPDGSRFLMGSQANKYIDRNGNTLTYLGGGRWTDTLGRAVGLVLTNAPATPTSDQVYALTGFGGAPRHYTFRYRYLAEMLGQQTPPTMGDMNTHGAGTYPGLFRSDGGTRVTPPTQFNPAVLSEIELPDGSKYRFEYNEYGEVSKVVFPTGGYERYRHDVIPGLDPVNQPYAQTNRGVTDRWVSESGAAADERRWQYSVTAAAEYIVTVTNPDGTYAERRLLRGRGPGVLDYGFDDARAGRAYDERAYSASGQMLRRTLTDWTMAGTQSSGTRSATATRDPRVTRTVEILLDTGGDALWKTTSYEYDADLNVKSTGEYGYARMSRSAAMTAAMTSFPAESARLLRTSETTFLVNDPVVSQGTKDEYRARNLVALPTSTRVLDAAGNVVAQSAVAYDEATARDGTANPVSYGAITGWSDPGTAARGNATTSRNWLNTDDSWVETHAQYDQGGNVVKAWDAHAQSATVHGRVTETVFTSAYRYAYPVQVISPVPDQDSSDGVNGSTASLVTHTAYDLDTGLVTSTTDASGQVTRFYYAENNQVDPLSRLRRVEAPGGGWAEYEYGNAPFGFYVRTRRALDAGRATDSYQYFDGVGRPSRAYSYDGSAPDRTWVATKTTYDVMGRVATTSNPAFRTNLTDFDAPAVTTTLYDALGRVVTVTTPDGAQVTTSYDAYLTDSLSGSRVTVTDQAGRVRSSVSDGLGRLVKVIEAPGAAGYGYETAYEYDLLGNLTKVVQGKAGQVQQTRTFSYDSLSRLKSAENPEGGTVTYEYDPLGNLKRKADARHVQTLYTYDALSRVTKRSYSVAQGQQTPAGYVATPEVSYYYDGAGMPEENGAQLPTPAYAAGRLTAVKSSVSETIYTEFDAAGRVKRHRQVVEPGTASEQKYLMEYGYDLAGNLRTQKYPSGKVVETEYDSAGRAAGVKDQAAGSYYAGAGAADAAGRIRYAAHGAVEALRLGNGLWEQTSFNSRLQPERIGLGTSTADTSRLRLTYGYGAAGENNGNVRSQRIEAGGLDVTQSYDYDAVNRLLSARETPTAGGSDAWRQAYTYLDSTGQNGQFGNRRIDTGTDPVTGQPRTTANATPQHNPQIEPLTNRIADGQDYTYDAAGNLRQDTAHTYAYDAENRVAEADGGWDGTAGASYYYDGDGRRVKKVSVSETTVFVYDALGRVAAEYSNQVQYKGTRYLTQDHLGSTRVVSDAQGNAHTDPGGAATGSRHDYFPFGEEIGAGAGGRTTGQGYSQFDGMRQKFTGQQRDGETGLDFFEARYYNYIQGRFTSVDPYNPIVDSEKKEDFEEYLGQPQNWNRYVYVWNNPLRYIDPFGEKVYVVTYTTGNSKGDDEFRRAAETKAQHIRELKGFDSKKDTVLVKGVYSKDDFNNVLEEANSMEKQFGKVAYVAVYAHADPDGPVFHDPRTGKGIQFSREEVANLRINWDRNAEAKFYGCYTKDFAQTFANAQGVTSHGYAGFAYFSNRHDKMVPDEGGGRPLYLIHADYGRANGVASMMRYLHGIGRVYQMVRRDPPPRDRPRR